MDTTQISRRQILVVGSCNTDMVIKAAHLPRPGETILGGTFFMNPGGKGANQAVAIARLGGSVTFICKTGSDIFGHQSQQLFEEEGINTSYVFSDSGNPSGVALITVDEKAENCIVVASGANANLLPSDLAKAEEAIELADLILMQLEVPMETVCFVADIAWQKGKKVILNPAPAHPLPADLLHHLYLITPNETEAEMITGVKITDDISAVEAARVLSGMGVQHVIITLGSKGALICSDGEAEIVPALKVEAVDTTAAGDVFNGALTVALSEGRNLKEYSINQILYKFNNMKKTILFTCLTALLAACSGKSAVTAPDETTVQPVNLILDTDLGPDYDDVGAMVLMHALADSGQVNILAVVSSNKDEHVVPCIEVLNTYFNRPDIPVGAPKSEGGVSLTTWHKTKWTEELPARYPHKTAKTSDASDAVKVYRRILSTQPDSSVVVCTIGFFTNLKDLLLSGGDEYSPLSGCDLVAKKVKRVVSMAGLFPEGKEFNVYCDTPASRVVAERWPTEIIFSGFEIGNMIFTGKKLVQMDVKDSPVKDAYSLCFAEGDPNGRMSWDLTAVLVAVKGYEPYYNVERGTFRVVNDEGANSWTPDGKGKDLRLIEKVPAVEMAVLIENYMMHQPVSK